MLVVTLFHVLAAGVTCQQEMPTSTWYVISCHWIKMPLGWKIQGYLYLILACLSVWPPTSVLSMVITSEILYLWGYISRFWTIKHSNFKLTCVLLTALLNLSKSLFLYFKRQNGKQPCDLDSDLYTIDSFTDKYFLDGVCVCRGGGGVIGIL